MYKRIPVEIKNEVLQKVRNGEKVIDLARLYGIGDKTIYQWLKESVKQEVSIWEHRRIKAENEELKRILGMVMLELERKKKVEIINSSTNKKLIAKVAKISHKNIYYKSRMEDKDFKLIEKLKQCIKTIHHMDI